MIPTCLNPIKLCAPLIFVWFIFAPLIFALLNNLYIYARIIFAHWKNLYFRADPSFDWKYSARHCAKYAQIRAFSDLYFPIYEENRICIFRNLERIGDDSVQIRKNTDTFLPIYGKMRIRKSLCLLIISVVVKNKSLRPTINEANYCLWHASLLI